MQIQNIDISVRKEKYIYKQKINRCKVIYSYHNFFLFWHFFCTVLFLFYPFVIKIVLYCCPPCTWEYWAVMRGLLETPWPRLRASLCWLMSIALNTCSMTVALWRRHSTLWSSRSTSRRPSSTSGSIRGPRNLPDSATNGVITDFGRHSSR